MGKGNNQGKAYVNFNFSHFIVFRISFNFYSFPSQKIKDDLMAMCSLQIHTQNDIFFWRILNN